MMNDWVQSQIDYLYELKGRVIVRWCGIEMAIRDNEDIACPDWYDESVPFLQLSHIRLTFTDESGASIDTYQNNITWGLYRRDSALPPFSLPEGPGSIFRTREFTKLPLGRIESVNLRLDGEDIAYVEMKIGNHVVGLSAGEVYETDGDEFRIVLLDESILVQVDGRHPVGI